jgi:hypothetical protein
MNSRLPATCRPRASAVPGSDIAPNPRMAAVAKTTDAFLISVLPDEIMLDQFYPIPLGRGRYLWRARNPRTFPIRTLPKGVDLRTFNPSGALTVNVGAIRKGSFSHEHCPSSPSKAVRAAMGCAVRRANRRERVRKPGFEQDAAPQVATSPTNRTDWDNAWHHPPLLALASQKFLARRLKPDRWSCRI